MATIAKLDILIGANTSRLAADFKKGQLSTHEFADGIKRASHTAKVALAGIAAGAAAMAIGITKQIASLDSVVKTADKLGITTEALTGLQHGAELSGVGIDTFNMSLQRMVRRVSEAARGTGEAQAAIKELGLDAIKLSKVSPDRALGAIGDALTKVQNPADRLRLAFKLFDSEGVAMVNMLRDGSAGLDEFRRQAASLGIVLDSNVARSIADANDAITNSRAALSGLMQQITIASIPALKQLTDGFKALMEAVSGAQTFFLRFRLAMLKNSEGAYGVDDRKRVAEMERVREQIKAISLDGTKLAANPAWGKAREEFIRLFGRAPDSWEDQKKLTQIIRGEIGNLSDDMVQAGGKITTSVADIAGAFSDLKGVSAVLDKLKIRQETLGLDAVELQIDALKRLGAETEQVAEARNRLKAIAEFTKDAQDAETLKSKIGGLREEISRFRLERAGATAGEMSLFGATGSSEDLRTLKGLTQSLDNLRQAKTVMDSLQTPMDDYQGKIADLSRLYRAGAFGIDTYRKAVEKTRRELEATRDAMDTGLNPILLKGQRETHEFLAQMRKQYESDQRINADVQNIVGKQAPRHGVGLVGPLAPEVLPGLGLEEIGKRLGNATDNAASVLGERFQAIADRFRRMPEIPQPMQADRLQGIGTLLRERINGDMPVAQPKPLEGGGPLADAAYDRAVGGLQGEVKEQSKRLDEIAKAGTETNVLLNRLIASQQQQRPKVFKL